MPNLPNGIAPPAIRGAAYSTPLYARCPNYHRCCRCLQCAAYNRHSALCGACESVHPEKLPCACRDDQEDYMIQIEDRIGRPVWSPSMEEGSVAVESSAFDGSVGQAMANGITTSD